MSAAPADWLPFLTELADRADEIALRFFRVRGLRVAAKPDASPVTEADQTIETTARALVRERHPELGILGEEQGEEPGQGEARLIIDPIDGTRNFVRGIPVFGALLAVEARGEVLLGDALLDRARENAEVTESGQDAPRDLDAYRLCPAAIRELRIVRRIKKSEDVFRRYLVVPSRMPLAQLGDDEIPEQRLGCSGRVVMDRHQEFLGPPGSFEALYWAPKIRRI